MTHPTDRPLLESVVDFIDHDRYPLHLPDSRRRSSLIQRCQSDLENNALCFLPGFLNQPALQTLGSEFVVLAPKALRNDYLRTAYSWMDNQGFDPAHPRSMLFRRRLSYLTNNLIQPSSLIQRLFEWDPLTDFVREALGFCTLYRSACPTLSIQLNIMYEGDVLPWHFDTNDGVVSLLVDNPDDGGVFQLAPYIRDEGVENYDAVLRAMREDPEVIRDCQMPAGTLILFKGRRSMHRVSPVGKTKKPRTIILYSYDEQPDMCFPKASQERMLYPQPAPYKGAMTPVDASGFIDWDTGDAA